MISLSTILAILGVALAIIEIVVLGFGTVFLIFAALGCFVTSGLMLLGIVPEESLPATLSVAIVSLVSAATLWKPLKRLQGAQSPVDEQPNVFPDLTFALDKSLTADESTSFQYSGITWQVFVADKNLTLEKGTEVRVVKTGVGKMWVESAD